MLYNMFLFLEMLTFVLICALEMLAKNALSDAPWKYLLLSCSLALRRNDTFLVPRNRQSGSVPVFWMVTSVSIFCKCAFLNKPSHSWPWPPELFNTCEKDTSVCSVILLHKFEGSLCHHIFHKVAKFGFPLPLHFETCLIGLSTACDISKVTDTAVIIRNVYCDIYQLSTYHFCRVKNCVMNLYL